MKGNTIVYFYKKPMWSKECIIIYSMLCIRITDNMHIWTISWKKVNTYSRQFCNLKGKKNDILQDYSLFLSRFQLRNILFEFTLVRTRKAMNGLLAIEKYKGGDGLNLVKKENCCGGKNESKVLYREERKKMVDTYIEFHGSIWVIIYINLSKPNIRMVMW